MENENIVPQTLEECEALLEKYKKQNPSKFAIKEASGEFDALRAQFGSKKPAKEVKEPIGSKKLKS